MSRDASELARRLARDAEAVCRHYLSRGRRQGRYWMVGDVRNTPGRSMFVRLTGPDAGPGAAGRWTDAAEATFGDLLDVIRISRRLGSFPDAIAEAQRFLGMPIAEKIHGERRIQRNSLRPQASGYRRQEPGTHQRNNYALVAPDPGNPFLLDLDLLNAARRLFMASVPIQGTLAEIYLYRRGITDLTGLEALRFNPACTYREDGDKARDGTRRYAHDTSFEFYGPALIAAVSDVDGWVTGLQRTWLDAEALMSNASLGPLLGKAALPSPRRALGALLGGGVRFGPSSIAGEAGVLLAGEGVETMLSLRRVLPGMPMIAALSAAHLAAVLFPPDLKRLYIAQDADPAGRAVTAKLIARASDARIEAIVLVPVLDDFNTDLRRFGAMALARHVRQQLAPDDGARLLLAQG